MAASMQNGPVRELLPVSAAVEGGVLSVGGVPLPRLAEEHGTPLVVYCERTIREAARAYREAAPDALLVYGTKAFPNVAILRLLAEEGFGADVSSGGELELARRAGIPGERIVVHGNNKGDDELAAAAELGALVAVDALDEVERAVAAGVRRALVRVTPGIEADTHEAIRTAHHGSKFGLPPHDAIAAVGALRDAGVDVEGIHVHIGSQLLHLRAAAMTVEWLALFSRALPRRARLDAAHRSTSAAASVSPTSRTRRRRRSPSSSPPSRTSSPARGSSSGSSRRGSCSSPAARSSAARASRVYRVGSIKRASEATTYVAVDGGLSDNPRPALYGARYCALLANRADEEPGESYAVAGRHCESGDLLIERVAAARAASRRPARRPGDGRLHAGDGLELQRRPAPGRRPRRRRRRAHDPPPRDDRRPARARGLTSANPRMYGRRRGAMLPSWSSQQRCVPSTVASSRPSPRWACPAT